MYYYVEMLRAKRALRVVAIILGLMLLAGVIVRLAIAHGTSPQAMAYKLEHSPTAHVTRTLLPGGGTRVTVDDPARRLHAVIVERGHNLRIRVSEPSALYDSQKSNTVVMGNVDRSARSMHGGMTRVHLRYSLGLDFSLAIVFALTIPMGLVVATLLAAPLSKENEGHLELAWTKPVTRERYAIAAIAVDLATIVLSQIITVAVVLLGSLLFGVPSITAGSLWLIGLALLAPLAWHATMTTVGASVRRGCGQVVLLTWVAGVFIPGIAAATSALSSSAVGAVVHGIFQALAYLDPISYTGIHVQPSGTSVSNPLHSLPVAVAVLAFLTLIYILTAVLQWRRVEA